VSDDTKSVGRQELKNFDFCCRTDFVSSDQNFVYVNTAYPTLVLLQPLVGVGGRDGDQEDEDSQELHSEISWLRTG
jgi:hypothetical protein